MISLEEAKQHLRVENTIEDAYITGLVDAAQSHVKSLLGDTLPEPLPSPIEAAVLILVGDLYENRTRWFDRINYENRTFDMLLNPYRSMRVEP